MINSLVKVRASEISGTGLFAIAPIKKGTVLMKFEGMEISDKEANRLYEKENFDYLLQISSNKFLFLDGPEKYLNHSCNPNGAFLEKSGELIAIRDISENEELFFDYSSNENTDFELKCNCGSPECRKIITPFYKLSNKQKRNIANILTPYLRNL